MMVMVLQELVIALSKVCFNPVYGLFVENSEQLLYPNPDSGLMPCPLLSLLILMLVCCFCLLIVLLQPSRTITWRTSSSSARQSQLNHRVRDC